MAAQVEGSGRWKALVEACCILAAAVATAAFVVLMVFIGRRFPHELPKYSVAVAAVAGLEPGRDLMARGRPTLSPVFNVTVRIDNARNFHDSGCVPDLSAAVVSYGDVVLGRGSVPKFCARPWREEEGVARAWGLDVMVPWFLRDQLAGDLAAGEATVDVEVRMPTLLLVCKAKIGGLSRCREPAEQWRSVKAIREDKEAKYPELSSFLCAELAMLLGTDWLQHIRSSETICGNGGPELGMALTRLRSCCGVTSLHAQLQDMYRFRL